MAHMVSVSQGCDVAAEKGKDLHPEQHYRNTAFRITQGDGLIFLYIDQITRIC